MRYRPGPARELVERFHRQRPLRAGSLIITLFGDAILPRGGAVSLRSLIDLAGAFRVNERLVRTATARLAQEGWLEARRLGKHSEYRLTEGGRERFAEATARIYGPSTAPWSGRWTLVVLPAMPTAERQRLRKTLAWQGFGEIASGVFAHPALHRSPLDLPTGALLFEADLASPSSTALIDLGWDLKDLAQRYRQFADRFERVQAELERDPDPGAAFVVRTLLIHEYRRFHLRDPLLPEALLPAAWPGVRAEQVCRLLYGRLFGPSERHLSAVGARLEGPLPPAEQSVLRRFGGLATP